MDQGLKHTPERRRYDREEQVCLIVRIGENIFEPTNWGMGGFLLTDYSGNLSTGSLVTVSGLGCRETGLQDVSLPSRVVRNGPNEIAVTYLSLDATAYTFLTDALTQCGTMRSLI